MKKEEEGTNGRSYVQLSSAPINPFLSIQMCWQFSRNQVALVKNSSNNSFSHFSTVTSIKQIAKYILLHKEERIN